MEGRGRSGIDDGHPGFVERGFEPRDQGFRRGTVRPWTADRRHRAGAKLLDDFLPGRGGLADTFEVQRVEREARRAPRGVVTGHAVLIEDRAVWS